MRSIVHLIFSAGLGLRSFATATMYFLTAIVWSTTALAAQDLARWNAARAEIFSEVCMASAPRFDDVGARAASSGFETYEGQLLYRPEAVLSVVQKGGTCSCFLTVGAPDPNAMVVAIFEQLVDRFPTDFRPTDGGTANETTWFRRGEQVIVRLTPEQVSGQSWLSATVTRAGEC